MKNTFVLNKRDYQRLKNRAYRAQQKDQSEICGAIVGSGNILCLEFMRNHSGYAGSFEIKLSELSKLRKNLKNSGKRIYGLFHSHVVGEAIPSKRDIADAPINSLMLIYDICGRQPALFRVIKGTQGEKSVSIRKLNYR